LCSSGSFLRCNGKGFNGFSGFLIGEVVYDVEVEGKHVSEAPNDSLVMSFDRRV
jgi:hypothetical protein